MSMLTPAPSRCCSMRRASLRHSPETFRNRVAESAGSPPPSHASSKASPAARMRWNGEADTGPALARARTFGESPSVSTRDRSRRNPSAKAARRPSHEPGGGANSGRRPRGGRGPAGGRRTPARSRPDLVAGGAPVRAGLARRRETAGCGWPAGPRTRRRSRDGRGCPRRRRGWWRRFQPEERPARFRTCPWIRRAVRPRRAAPPSALSLPVAVGARAQRVDERGEGLGPRGGVGRHQEGLEGISAGTGRQGWGQERPACQGPPRTPIATCAQTIFRIVVDG